jgi:hypothetical protein
MLKVKKFIDANFEPSYAPLANDHNPVEVPEFPIFYSSKFIGVLFS